MIGFAAMLSSRVGVAQSVVLPLIGLAYLCHWTGIFVSGEIVSHASDSHVQALRIFGDDVV